jgi:predicted metal-dependent phosphoesterase TrpH
MHSHFSFDSLSHPEKIVQQAIKTGLDGIAITDHNVFRIDWTALQRKYPDLIIIPGTEIGTEGVGDILCYFITEEIQTKDPKEVIDQVHKQGGLAVLAHPYHHGRTSDNYPDSIIKQLDAIEVANAHNTIKNKMAAQLAVQFNKPATGGSDAHIISEIGNGQTILDLTKDEARNFDLLKKAIKNSMQAQCKAAPMYSFYFSQMIKYMRRFKLLKQIGT